MDGIQHPRGTMGHVIEYRDAAGRATTAAEGRTTRHSFSFGAHYDPRNTGFGLLTAHNEELLPVGTGYAEHPHRDLDIVTWVLSGSLRHTSAVGSGVIGPGEVQRLHAGAGVVHAEVNDGTSETRFLQAWVRPDEPGGAPAYSTGAVDLDSSWTVVAGAAGVVPLAAAGSLLATELPAGTRLALPDAPVLHVFVATGELLLGERVLQPGDAARLTDEGSRLVTAEAPAQVLVWAFG